MRASTALLRGVLLVVLLACAAARAAPMRFVYPPPEVPGDERHLYYWQLLDAALASNEERYGKYTLSPFALPMTFQRAAAEVEAGGARVNVISRATSLDLEKRLLPVRIPLDKGLLGVRLFLIMPETQARLDRVKTLADLRQFSIGQGSSWTDVRILESAGFKLVLADAYAPLFAMLAARRFDLFSRGAIEIEAELASQRKTFPEMTIDKRLILHYPMPRYFFVPRTSEGRRMAERIEDGLQRLRRSGEFERRYLSWKGLVLKDLELSGRTVLRLPNPELSPEAPLADAYWWDDLASEVGTPR